MKTIQQQDRYIDCIELKRSIQKEISDETKGMKPRERLAYYKKLAAKSPFASSLRLRKQHTSQKHRAAK